MSLWVLIVFCKINLIRHPAEKASGIELWFVISFPVMNIILSPYLHFEGGVKSFGSGSEQLPFYD